MFGLEKKKKKPFFEFDLQKDLKDSKKQKKYAEETEEKIHQLKDAIRKGADSDKFTQLGVLLHGYTSLLKVVNHPHGK